MEFVEGAVNEIVTGPSGRYSLDEQIGRGGVGEVFKAHDTQLQRWVAIKRLHSEDLAAPERAGKTIQEARHLAALQHPNIVTVYDFIENNGDVLVVMELLRGRTLEQVVEAAPLTAKDFVEVMRQILEGLNAAHEVGMLHRDIKPTNIMVLDQRDGSFQVKILDFGLAKITAAPSLQTTDIDGGLLGSIFFMSPEQLESRPLDFRSDLYSLGCVAYYLLTTHFPFQGETVPEVIISHLQQRLVPLRDLRSDLPLALCQWVDRLIALNPNDRPGTAAQALEELRRATTSRASRPLPQPASPLEDPKKRRMLMLYIGVPVVLALAIAAPIIWPETFQVKKVETTRVESAAGATGPSAQVIAPAPEIPVMTPNDRPALVAMADRKVVVEGLIDRAGVNKSGTIRFLNFAGTDRGDLSLVFFVKEDAPDFTEANLQGYVGKTVRVKGRVALYEGNPQIVVTSLSQLETL